MIDGLNPARSTGVLRYGGRNMPCTLGRGGRRAIKREGDGATPAGLWPIREILYRADRMRRLRTKLPLRVIRPDDAWCDVAGDPNYNRAVRLPYATLDERLWRDDHLYDIIAVLGYNDFPRVQGLGSAIFMHGMRPGMLPTAGCIGLELGGLRRLLELADPPNWIRIAI